MLTIAWNRLSFCDPRCAAPEAQLSMLHRQLPRPKASAGTPAETCSPSFRNHSPAHTQDHDVCTSDCSRHEIRLPTIHGTCDHQRSLLEIQAVLVTQHCVDAHLCYGQAVAVAQQSARWPGKRPRPSEGATPRRATSLPWQVGWVECSICVQYGDCDTMFSQCW